VRGVSSDPTNRPAWADDPVVLERIFHAALKEGDVKGVHAALRLMAGCDPHRAQELLDAVELGLHVANGGDVAVKLIRAGGQT
jgi:hypothetical protein